MSTGLQFHVDYTHYWRGSSAVKPLESQKLHFILCSGANTAVTGRDKGGVSQTTLVSGTKPNTAICQ